MIDHGEIEANSQGKEEPLTEVVEWYGHAKSPMGDNYENKKTVQINNWQRKYPCTRVPRVIDKNSVYSTVIDSVAQGPTLRQILWICVFFNWENLQLSAA